MEYVQQSNSDDLYLSLVHPQSKAAGLTWHLVPPRAPHFGGLWEAAVKTAKKHLYRQLGSARLTFEGYCTVLCQIEAVMNSRPLLPMSSDPNDLAALTPAHFLIGSSLLALPDLNYSSTRPSSLSELQQMQLMVQQFWKHWRNEYLQELQRDTVRAVRNDSIRPGRMAILIDDTLPVTRWPLARITKVHPGKDGIPRVVGIRTARGDLTRPITKICLLPDTQKQN
ncbi:uncharacterized protein LOC128270459 [Anopheles cruzii]|uniref:uncharacterized protein LOC128270459 n=1 Tax=Anopheles cruzii TaxID=68878 RepID=UPI0022EC23D8|nr:uncharacterized protein LOC128270459 [Anopheles cruzii]